MVALAIGAAIAPPVLADRGCTAGMSSMPTERFRDNGDGTVTDMASKLMWMRCAMGQQWSGKRCVGAADSHDWRGAQRQADGLSQNGSAFFNDWRVPSLRDLATISDRGCGSPRTNEAVFPDTPAAPFWSSTQRPGENTSERALALSFGAEGVLVALKAERFHVRLVRKDL